MEIMQKISMLKNFGRRENVFFFFMFHSHIIFLTFRNCLLNLQKDFIAKNNDKWRSLYDNSTTCTSHTSNKISLDVELRKFLYRKFPLFLTPCAFLSLKFRHEGIVPTQPLARKLCNRHPPQWDEVHYHNSMF